MTYPVSDKVKEALSSKADTVTSPVLPGAGGELATDSLKQKVEELSKAVSKNQVIGTKESLDVASKCQDEVSKILNSVPEEKREELVQKCKEARAKGREEIQEEIKKNGVPKTPWYSPIVNFGETLVDVGIAAAGTVATVPKLPEVWKAQANGAITAIKDGKGITGAIAEGFKAGYNKHVENLEVAGEAINTVREFSEKHLGGSYLGSEKEFAAKSDLSLAATSLGAGAQVALLPEALVCTGIQAGMNGVDSVYDATARKGLVSALGEDSSIVKAGDVALEVGKIGASVAALAKGQGSSALRMLGVATLMSGTSALASELYTAKLPREEFSLGRLAENTLKGTAGSVAFMGGLTLGGKALALRSAENAVRAGQGVEQALNEATKTALKLSAKADFVDAVTSLGQTADMWDNADGTQQKVATLLQLGVNAFDSKDCIAAGAVGHVNVQDITTQKPEGISRRGIPASANSLALADPPDMARSYTLAKRLVVMPQGIDNKITSAVRGLVDEILNKDTLRGEKYDVDCPPVVMADDIFEEIIAEAGGERPNGRYSKELKLATKEFFNCLTQRVPQIEGQLSPEQRKILAQKIYNLCFSATPSIIECLPVADRLRYASYFQISDVLAAADNRSTDSGIMLNASFGDSNFGDLYVQISQFASGAMLDAIKFVEKVGVHGFEESWAGKASQWSLDTIKQIKDDSSSPIVKYACALAESRILAESENPMNREYLPIDGDVVQDDLSKRVGFYLQANGKDGAIKDQSGVSSYQQVAADAIKFGRRFLVVDKSRSDDEGGIRDVSDLSNANLVARNTNRTYPCLATSQLTPRDQLLMFNADFAARIMEPSKLGSEVLSDLTEYTNNHDPYLRGIDSWGFDRAHQKASSSQETKTIAVMEIPNHLLGKDVAVTQLRAEESLDLALLLEHLHEPEMRARIEDDLKISLNEIPLRNQIHFLRYLAGQNSQGYERLQTVLLANPDNATTIANCFLANAEDSRYGEAILKIAENRELASEKKGLIFDQYNELVSGIDGIESYLRQTYGKEASAEEINAIRQRIISRANNLMEKYAKRLAESPVDADMLAAGFSRLAKENLLYATTFRNAASFDEVKDTRIITANTEELTPDQWTQIRNLSDGHIAGNYQESGYQRLLRTQYDALEQSPDTEYFVLEHKGRILGVVRHTKIGDHTYYGGGYVLTEEARNNGLGEAFNQRVLEQEGKDNNIVAMCSPKLADYHTSAFGFQKAGETDNYLSTGHTTDWIVRPAQNPSYALTPQQGMARTQEFIEGLYRKAGEI